MGRRVSAGRIDTHMEWVGRISPFYTCATEEFESESGYFCVAAMVTYLCTCGFLQNLRRWRATFSHREVLLLAFNSLIVLLYRYHVLPQWNHAPKQRYFCTLSLRHTVHMLQPTCSYHTPTWSACIPFCGTLKKWKYMLLIVCWLIATAMITTPTIFCPDTVMERYFLKDYIRNRVW